MYRLWSLIDDDLRSRFERYFSIIVQTIKENMKIKIHLYLFINSSYNKDQNKYIRVLLIIYNPDTKYLATHHHGSLIHKKGEEMNEYQQ